MSEREINIAIVPITADVNYDLAPRSPASLLAERGHRVTIIGWNGGGRAARLIRAHGGRVSIYLLPGLNIGLPGLTWPVPLVLGVATVLKKVGFDILWIYKHANPSIIPPVLLARRMNKPVVFVVQGVRCDINPIVNTLYYAYLRSFDKMVCDMASKVVVLNKSDAISIQRLGCPAEKIKVIPNGIDTELFRPLRDGDPFLVVGHGRLVRGKGLEDLIKAIHILRRHYGLKARLNIVGDGPLKPYLMEMVRKLRLKEHVSFVGWIPYAEIPRLSLIHI